MHKTEDSEEDALWAKLKAKFTLVLEFLRWKLGLL